MKAPLRCPLNTNDLTELIVDLRTAAALQRAFDWSGVRYAEAAMEVAFERAALMERAADALEKLKEKQ